MAQIDCFPSQAIMDTDVDIRRYPAPPKMIASRKNSAEKLLDVTQRFHSAKFRGFNATCMFCGLSRKGNSSQFRVHFTNESKGGTACSPCSKVPVAIKDFYIEQRELYMAKKGNGPAEATVLHNSFRDGDILCEGEDEADSVTAIAEGEARLACRC
jgi:hypothetical protein